jgi:hypothetical protein
MKFSAQTIKPVDFTKLKTGSVASATLTSFNYVKDYVFGTFVSDGKSIRCIIGSKADYKIMDLIPLKGTEVTIEFAGTKVSEGKTYPIYYMGW